MSESKIVLIDHELEIHKKIVVVNWNLGNQCNFRCSYCADSLNCGSHPWLEMDKIINFVDALFEHYSQKLGKTLLFEFTGGEVTLYKDLFPLLEYLKNKHCKTEILSNGSPKLPYWEKIKDLLDNLILSYHAEYCRPDHFYEVVKYLAEFISIHVNIMMHRQYFDQCRDLGLAINQSCPNVSISFQPLLNNLTDNTILMNYTAEELSIIDELHLNRKLSLDVEKRHRGRMINYFSDGREDIVTPELYVTERKNHWKGWLCWTGLEQIIVTQQGDVFRAWCLQDQLGDIYHPLEFPIHPTVCTRSICHCNMDIMTKKQLPVYLTPENIAEVTKLVII